MPPKKKQKVPIESRKMSDFWSNGVSSVYVLNNNGGWRWQSLQVVFLVIVLFLLLFAMFTSYYLLAKYDKPRESRRIVDSLNTISPSPSRVWTANARGNVYVYSAHRRCRNSHIIVVNGWEHNPPKHKSADIKYTCCVRALNGSLYTSPVHAKFGFFQRTNLMSIRVACRDPVFNDNYTVLVVRSSIMNQPNKYNPASLCPHSNAEYVAPIEPILPETYRDLEEAEESKVDQNCLPYKERNPNLHKSEKFSLAICAKLAYGDLEPNLLIEWIEYNRKMRVSKIAVYIYRLNPLALRVLRYYEQLGFIVILDFFNMPLKTDAGYRRQSPQHWNDEQVALYDCHDQLRLFKYVAVVDFDEFIVPNLDKDFVGLSERLYNNYPTASEFHLNMRFHYIAKNANRSGEGLYSEKYGKNTCPSTYNPKMLTIPGRMPLAGSYTHEFTQYLKPYKTSIVWANPSMVYISHYKRCPNNKPTPETCLKMLHCKTSNITMHVDQHLKQVIKNKKKLLLG